MFQSLQATFVIITDLSQKVKGFLAFCSTFFKSFFLPDIQLAGFSSYVFPPRFVAWASQRISTFASLFLYCCLFYSFFRFFLLFKKQLDKRLCFDYSIANER